jgi:hypothetical protein
MQSSQSPHSSRFAFWSVLAMLALISVPVAITLATVKTSAYLPLAQLLPQNPSPHGYTVSLFIFIVPVVLIGFWFLPNDRIHISKRSFRITIIGLFVAGAGLDFFFAHRFFYFPNPDAVSGIPAPALGAPVPIEEYFFYLFGFLTILLLYLWLDGYWLHAYSVPENDTRRISVHRLLRFHPDSLILAVVLIAAAVAYKRFSPAATPGFPGYFTFLVICSLSPSIALFPSVNTLINWRALSLTLFLIVLASVLWEATLALPYGWWGYQPSAIVGIYIRAWHDLPIEAVFVWIGITYATVIIYEAVRAWQSSGKSARHAFLGVSAAGVSTDPRRFEPTRR